ncbi:MAG: hypothetical protein HOP18_19380 [Deltaproteobacteria bacterium]|nr:hypothetical protein [Deltaproteobacteria bacterium]
MTRLFTIVQTGIQYGIARLRVLCTTRVLWSVLTVSGIVLLAVIGTSAAWRARTSSAETERLAPESFTNPALEFVADPVPSPAAASHSRAPLMASAPIQRPMDGPSALPDDLRNPFTDTSLGEERAQRTETQRLRATQQHLERMQTEVKIAEQRKELARIASETHALTHPPRAAKPTTPPSPPQITVLSVSSTAALVQQGHWRQIVQRGARLNGWTVVRLAPTGITVRRAQRYVFLPLSFATPATPGR